MKTLYLSGIVGYEITADNIRSQISEGSKEKLQVIVNSPGGFVIDAFEIYNIFNMYKGEVEFVINGMAASAMSYIIMSGDKISAFKNSIFMAHKAQSIAFGDSDMIQTEADIARAMDNILAESYVGRMKKPKEQILADMKNEIWHIGWEALTEAGIIDNVIDSPDEIEFPDEESKVVFMMEEPDRERAALHVQSCLSRMRNDPDKARSNSMKAAAILPIQNQTPTTPVEDIIIQEDSMDLKQFLDSNPEAMAEYNTALQTARAEGENSIKAEYANDRKRIANILELSGVKISDDAISAIENNIQSGEFAEKELLRQKELRAKSEDSPFANLASKQTPAEQDPTGAVVVESSLDPAELKAKVKNVLDQIGGI